MAELILAIDQGTTGSTALVFDRAWELRARGYQEFRQIYPKPGWVEHDPEAIWGSVLGALGQALKAPGVRAEDIQAIGVTNQRETVVAWEPQTGRPLNNAIVWQCRRTQQICEELKTRGLEELFTRKTGLLLDPYFSGTKLKWLLENAPGLAERAASGGLRAGTVDSFVIWRLTGGKSFVTDASNASRTLLMDLETGEWSPELAEILNVPLSVLPAIQPSAGQLGHTRGVPGLPDGIPITGALGDQQAALFGQACFEPGQAKVTLGTGAFLLMNTGKAPVRSKSRLLTTVAWRLGDQTTYALEGSAFIAGALIQWLRDGLGMIKAAAEVENLALEAGSSEGVTLVPAFTGLGAPHWRPQARGLITGLTRGVTRGHIAFAALEAIALQNADIFTAMAADADLPLAELRCDGGAAANDLLLQLHADFMGVALARPTMLETTGLGAAMAAGLGAGLFGSLADLKRAWPLERGFKPAMEPEKREAALTRWARAVAKA